MGDIHMEDVSGRPPTLAEIREARQAASKLIIVAIGKLPPEIAIQATNMLRCIQFLEQLLASHEVKRAQAALEQSRKAAEEAAAAKNAAEAEDDPGTQPAGEPPYSRDA